MQVSPKDIAALNTVLNVLQFAPFYYDNNSKDIAYLKQLVSRVQNHLQQESKMGRSIFHHPV